MFDLEDAIRHAEEVAEEKEKEGKLLCQSECASIGCLTCADEHRQLAEWLKELKQLKEQEPILDKIRAEIDRARFIDKDTRHCRNALASGLEVALQIIDKYKAESEVD